MAFTNDNANCHDCGKYLNRDFLTVYDLGTAGHDLVEFCGKCLSKYPKRDPRDWRQEEHPDEFGIITWPEGSMSFRDADGNLQDVLFEDDSDVEETEFVPSLENFLTDVPNHIFAALCLLIIFLSGTGLLILLAGKAVAK